MTQPPQGSWSDPDSGVQPNPNPYGAQPNPNPYGAQPDQTPYGAQPNPNPYGSGPAYAGGEPPLDQPHYGISFVPAVKRALKKYVRFDGRASRSEYWWWVLAVNVVLAVIGIPALIIGQATSTDGGETPGTPALPLLLLLALVALAVVLPSVAVLARRLHDAGMSGWLVLLSLIPSLGGLILLVLAILPSSPAGARYDRVPAA